MKAFLEMNQDCGEHTLLEVEIQGKRWSWSGYGGSEANQGLFRCIIQAIYCITSQCQQTESPEMSKENTKQDKIMQKLQKRSVQQRSNQ